LVAGGTIMKKSIPLFIAIFTIALLFGCGVSEIEYNKLKVENDSLKSQLDNALKQIDEYANGEERLIGIIDKAYKDKDYKTVKENINILVEKHPESKKIKEYEVVLKGIEVIEQEEQKKREAEEKERIRQANLNNTGIWEVSYYVDKFGDATKERYIRNTEYINGLFSNTATQNSDLNVRFLIDGSTSISIMLYEYARNNPVKAMSEDRYSARIKDKDGNKFNIRGTNYSDRITFSEDSSRIIHKALMKGGQIQIWIQEDDTPTTQYSFTIQNADWYENAYAKLKSKT